MNQAIVEVVALLIVVDSIVVLTIVCHFSDSDVAVFLSTGSIFSLSR
ncbi:hypothetical protein [Mesomycoplasma ovipneumoniae]